MTDYYRHFTVIIGEISAPECCNTMWTYERYLPRILTEIGVFPSVGEIRRNRRDLMREISGNERIRVGRKVIDIIAEEETCVLRSIREIIGDH